MTERRVLVGATVLVVGRAVAIGLSCGELAGWGFPGSQGLWALGYVASGALIMRSRSDHPVGRLLMWAGLASGVVQLTLVAGEVFGVDALFDAANSFGWMLADVLLLGALGRFPDGDWATPWARRFAAVAVLAGAASGVLWFAGGDPSWLGDALFIPFQANLAVAGVVLVVVLLRRGPVVRRQTGWVLFALGVAGTLGALAAAFEGGAGGGVLTLASAVSVVLVPLSIFVAVTRYRLYEIDRIISRTVSYGIVVGAMAVVYVGVVVALGSVLELSGNLEVAIATLAAVAVSLPLVRRVRVWVDRRFFRNRYDSARVVARVADELRTTVDLGHVERRTEAVIEEVFAPEEVSVWLAVVRGPSAGSCSSERP